jgi:hypothetical protein
MPTKIELCQQLHQELKIAGTLSTTVGNIGQLDRLCNAIVKADRFIQMLYTDWKFLWREWENTLVEDKSSYSPPQGIGAFDENSFWLDAGTEEAYKINYADYKRWRDELRHIYTESDSEPFYVVIKPNNSVIFTPTPNSVAAGKVVTADYWLAPVELKDDGQISLIPEQFHDAIVAMGKYYYGEYTQNSELQYSALQQYTPILKKLEAHSLPGRFDDNKNESSFPKTIVVE